jgi:16S rRNA (guanine527-N7)-methyltransferase
VWDLGSGLGIPGIPLAILRSDLLITLVEANKRKAVFLMEAVGALQLTNVTILNQRLESIRGVEPESCVTVRAIERMNQILPEILEVGSKCAQFLLFGSRETESIAVHWLPQDREMQSHLIPCSHHRLLLCLNRST